MMKILEGLKENKRILLLIILLGMFGLVSCSKTTHRVDDHAEAKGAEPVHDHGDHAGHDHEPKESTAAETHDHLHAPTGGGQDIRWQRPQWREAVSQLEMTGVIELDQRRTEWVTARISGRVASIRADIADRVQSGDELMVIDSPELLQLKEAFLRSAQELRLSRASLHRARDLAEQKGIEPKTLLERDTRFRIDEAQHLSARAALLRLNISSSSLKHVTADECSAELMESFLSPLLTVRAPLSGLVMERSVEVGEWVGSDRMLQRIADTQQLWGVFNATLPQAARLSKSAEVQVRIQGEERAHYTGRLDRIHPRLDAQSRMLPLRVLIDNPAGTLLPGMFASAQLRIVALEKKWLIPGQAHTLINGVGGVFVRDGDGFRFQPMPDVGRDGEGFLIVPQEWKHKEVVIEGVFALKAQMLLQSGSADPHAGHAH